MSKYDFNSLENQIDMMEAQLSEEINRYRSQSNKVSVIMAVFGILFFFVPQIYSFTIHSFSICKWYIWSALIIYILSSLTSIILFVVFLWPSQVPQKASPDFFYSNLMKQYLDKEFDTEESNKGVQLSYLGHIKECLLGYRLINNRKGKIHFWIYRSVIIALLCYLFIVPYVISNEKKEPLKIIIMSNDQDQKKTVTPEDVITVTPIKVREGFSRIEISRVEDSVNEGNNITISHKSGETIVPSKPEKKK